MPSLLHGGLLLLVSLPLVTQLVVATRLLRKSSANTTSAPSFEPFDKLWVIGKMADQIVLVTSSHVRYLVNVSTLPDDGTVPLYNASTAPQADILPHKLANLSKVMPNRSVIIYHDNKYFLHLVVAILADYNCTKRQTYIINLKTKKYTTSIDQTLDCPGNPGNPPWQVWLSSPAASTFFQIRHKQLANSQVGISLARYRITWNSGADDSIFEVNNVTEFYTICLADPEKHDQRIYLTADNCRYPVHWEVTTGFADEQFFYLLGTDRVHIFEKVLLSKSSRYHYGHFVQMNFYEFFWKKQGKGRNGNSAVASSAQTLLVVGVIIFLLTLVCVIYLHWDYLACRKKKRKVTQDEKPACLKEAHMRTPKATEASKNKTKTKARAKKKRSGTPPKNASKLLPSAYDFQKMSIKTDWSEDEDAHSAESRRLKGPSGPGNSSSSKKQKKSTSRGKLKGGGAKGKAANRASPCRSKGKLKRAYDESSYKLTQERSKSFSKKAKKGVSQPKWIAKRAKQKRSKSKSKSNKKSKRRE